MWHSLVSGLRKRIKTGLIAVPQGNDKDMLERSKASTAVGLLEGLMLGFEAQKAFGSVSLEVFYEDGRIVRCVPKTARSIKP